MTEFCRQVGDKLLEVNWAALRREIRAVARSRRARTGSDAWYETSYDAFKDLPRPDRLGDFVQRIAFAYSWLATIPEGAPSVRQFKAVQQAVQRVYEVTGCETRAAMKARWDARARLILATQRAMAIRTTTAIVAVSKVLHFWDAELAPMLDVNAIAALTQLPSIGEVQAEISRPERDDYLWYWELAFLLRQRRGVSYRKLDTSLFRSGRTRRASFKVEKERRMMAAIRDT